MWPWSVRDEAVSFPLYGPRRGRGQLGTRPYHSYSLDQDVAVVSQGRCRIIPTVWTKTWPWSVRDEAVSSPQSGPRRGRGQSGTRPYHPHSLDQDVAVVSQGRGRIIPTVWTKTWPWSVRDEAVSSPQSGPRRGRGQSGTRPYHPHSLDQDVAVVSQGRGRIIPSVWTKTWPWSVRDEAVSFLQSGPRRGRGQSGTRPDHPHSLDQDVAVVSQGRGRIILTVWTKTWPWSVRDEAVSFLQSGPRRGRGQSGTRPYHPHSLDQDEAVVSQGRGRIIPTVWTKTWPWSVRDEAVSFSQSGPRRGRGHSGTRPYHSYSLDQDVAVVSQGRGRIIPTVWTKTWPWSVRDEAVSFLQSGPRRGRGQSGTRPYQRQGYGLYRVYITPLLWYIT